MGRRFSQINADKLFLKSPFIFRQSIAKVVINIEESFRYFSFGFLILYPDNLRSSASKKVLYAGKFTNSPTTILP